MEPAEKIDFFSYMPEELNEFVKHDTYSLLIKGLAGTGKTTLALTILRALKGISRFFYLSTRTSPKQLFQYYPWLESFVDRPKIQGQHAEDSGQVFSANFEDARLDEPESLFERITNQLMDIKSPIIIIDSWDAIASFMDKEARLNNERVLQTWRERAGAKLIFISEHPADTTLDFLVDGIVELRQIIHDGARLREISFHKMRGVKIERTNYFYTLEGSMFRSIPPYLPLGFRAGIKHMNNKAAKRRKRHSIESSVRETGPILVTGYDSLDKSLGGGFPVPGIVLLELDTHVTSLVALEFMAKPLLSFLHSDLSIVFQPFDSMDSEVLYSNLSPWIPDSLDDRFKISSTSFGVEDRTGSKHVTGNQKPIKAKLPDFMVAVEAVRKRNPGKPVIQIVSGDQFSDKLGSNELGRINPQVLASLARSSKDLLLAIVRSSNSQGLQDFAEVSDIHIRLVILDGTLILQSIIPSSAPFAVLSNARRGDLSLAPLI